MTFIKADLKFNTTDRGICVDCGAVLSKRKYVRCKQCSADARIGTGKYKWDNSRSREWERANRSKNHLKIISWNRKHTIILRNNLLSLLGGQCVSCEENRREALQVDHRYNDGQKDRRRFAKISFYRYYLRHPQRAKVKLQILCANCNYLKLEESRSRGIAYISQYRQKTREKLIALLGARCIQCANNDKRVLCFDHIFGGGVKERKKFKSYIYGFYNQYLKNPEYTKTNLQLLCRTCNAMKQMIQREHSYKYAI